MIFFVKDRVDKGEFQIEYTPTGEMLADYFTKPLQGNLFRKFRAVIMGHCHISTLKTVQNDEIKERVEQCVHNHVISTSNEKAKSPEIKKVSFNEPPTIKNGERIKTMTYLQMLTNEDKIPDISMKNS